MAEYNFNDINDAKKRVREMQNRVKEKTPESKNAAVISLLEGLPSQKDRAFMLCAMYVLTSEVSDTALLDSILTIFF